MISLYQRDPLQYCSTVYVNNCMILFLSSRFIFTIKRYYTSIFTFFSIFYRIRYLMSKMHNVFFVAQSGKIMHPFARFVKAIKVVDPRNYSIQGRNSELVSSEQDGFRRIIIGNQTENMERTWTSLADLAID